MEIDNKKIILTGASSGIGKEILKKLLNYNCDVIAVARNVQRIPNLGEHVIPYSCDVSVKEEVDKLFEFALDKFKNVDIFIANAGFAYCEQIDKADWEHINKIYSTNVYSPIYSAEKMKSINKGREYSVVITCSAVARVALPGYSLYCSTKAAIDSFAKNYRYEMKDNGNLSLVYPVATNTNFFKKAADSAPVPWPVQSPAIVAKKVIRGIEKNKRKINPSAFYTVGNIMDGILHFIYPIYEKIQAGKFDKWLKAKKNNLL